MSAESPGTSNTVSTQLLLDLVGNTLDPGYAAAALERGSAPETRWFDRPAVAIGCALIGFTLVVAYIHTHRGAPQAARVHDTLVSRVRDAQHRDEQLATRAQQLNSSVISLRDRALSGDSGISRELDREQLLSGQSAAMGPGLEVELKQPPRSTASAQAGRDGSSPIAAADGLTDRDVRSVVNELWADGAEAISVNDIRLTPTSAIRFAGEAVLVDFDPITSPYTVRAIGNADNLATGFASSEVASRYQTLASAEGIGFKFSERAKMTLPARPSVAPRLARPITASPTPTGTTR